MTCLQLCVLFNFQILWHLPDSVYEYFDFRSRLNPVQLVFSFKTANHMAAMTSREKTVFSHMYKVWQYLLFQAVQVSLGSW